MGSSQSSHAYSNNASPSNQMSLPESVRGRKSLAKGAPHGLRASIVSESSNPFVERSEHETVGTTEHSEQALMYHEEEEGEDTDVDDSDDESADEEELDEGLEERRLILADAKNLKLVAEFYMHPENPIEEDGLSSARCFFERMSAPARVSVEEAEEHANILADTQALKKLAVDYLHPEIPVETSDPNACGRNYFTRPSAPEQESEEESMEHAQILADVMALKKLAVDYLHPELPVETTDPLACGRNYFTRASAPQHESAEEAEERAQILADSMALKKLAADYLHPEVPVTTTDSFAYGRNYFSRPSAPEQESIEEDEERTHILEEAMQLKKLATDYMHPEMPVTMDPFAFGRNYFSRASAPEQESIEEVEERARVLEEAKQLKKLAVDYLHPEMPVETTDTFACGRNYFSRVSAPEQESIEEVEERARVLEEVMQLKKLAVDYLHPEKPIQSSDPFACGRNYFSRPSAPEQESVEEDMERTRVLKEAFELKQLATDYMHPELPVKMDAFACGRNYFSRASAPEQESVEEAEERARVLEEAMQLKKLATDYLHPEVPVSTTDSFACGRNYFSRASAPDQESKEEADERAQILADSMALKKLAVDYLHPEVPVATTDPFACGRNYFSRPSAPQEEDEEEHARILEDMQQLKKLAADYLHPEVPVSTTDPFACGRNYFSRASAPEQESIEEVEERVRVLEETKQLKKLALDYLHPEKPVETTDPFACGRNYFSRASAPEQESKEDDTERTRVLQEVSQLKKLAVDYLHPELPVKTMDAFGRGRNYFNRPGAHGHAQYIHTYPSHEDDMMHEEHHHMDHFGMDEEMDLYADMRHHLETINHANEHDNNGEFGDKEEEGKLSRSPSSVMLFTDEPIY